MGETVTSSPPDIADDVPSRGRRFWIILAAICLLALIIRLLILSQYIEKNPFAIAPRVDAEVYWNWAEKISQGQLQLETPFFSAPLYPFLLGALRAMGGTLTSVYLLQLIMDLLTAILLARVGAKRFGNAVGIVSAAVFLSMLEPASYSLRVLSGSLQLLLVAATWNAMVELQDRPTHTKRLAVGISTGLLCLAYPPAILLVFMLWPLFFLNSNRKIGDALRAAIPVVAAVATVTPATIHNWRACGEFIPISAHAGITLYQGNAPGATGGYTPIQNISIAKDRMHIDAARVFERETGHQGTWREIDSHFIDKTIERWTTDFSGMARLAGRKLRWFLTGRLYSDIYTPAYEILAGFGSRMRMAPVLTAWIFGPAIIGFVSLMRRPVRFGFELILMTLPVLIVMSFWYSPRYRLPIIPVAAVLASLACVRAVNWRKHPGWLGPTLIALTLALILGPSNRNAGFDTVEQTWPTFATNTGIRLELTDQFEEASKYYEQALSVDPYFVAALLRSSRLAVRRGDMDHAISLCQVAVQAEPDNAEAHSELGMALLSRNVREAREHLSKALELDPSLESARIGLNMLE